GITSQFLGKLYSPGVYKDLQSKLFALDYFKINFTAEAEPGDEDSSSVAIIFSVEEKPLVDDIKITGNNKLRKGDILDSILLKRDDIFSTTKLKYDKDTIIDLYHSKGYPDTSVEATSLELSDNTVEVTFRIDEGSQTRIKEIIFSGNQVFSESTLKGKLSIKAQSLLNSGVFEDNKLESDKYALESYYKERGYLDAKVVDVGKKLVESENGRNYLALTFIIEEGQKWIFEQLNITGNELFSEEELLKLINHKKGDIINKSRFDMDFSRLSDLYYNDGYIYNDIQLTEERNETNNTITYNLNIIEKGRAHIENIIIKGNVKTKDIILYREIPMVEGDIFSKDKVIAGIQNLYNTGLFSTVAPETPYGSAAGLMDLVINVEEGKNTDIQFGVTFTGAAGDYPIAGFLKWNENNFRGMGQTLSIGTELSPTKQSLTLGFTERWFMGKRWSLGGNFAFSHQVYSGILQDILPVRFTEDDYNNEVAAPDPYSSYDEWKAAVANGETIDSAYLMDYDNIQFSIGANTGYTFHTPIGRFTTATGVSSALNNIFYDNSVYRPYNPAIRNNLENWQLNDKLWLNLMWDKRDFVTNPTNGFLLNQLTTYTGGFIGGDTHYIKSQSKAEAFLKLIDVPVSDNYAFKTVLAVHTSFSAMLKQYYYDDANGWDWNINATTGDMLYTDGMNIARGWRFKQDGEAMWDNWIELRMPIAENVLWGDLFFSGTGFWTELSEADITKNDFIDDFYFSFGGGIRFTIPGLPIGLYLTKRFKINNGVIDWEQGDIFTNTDNPDSGMDLVIAFQFGLF
ncbi:MAG: outer membrane protein assembly factor BamA, partial [Spirochaetia bacterium]|nr:outer membrane protein assembly factor BamA [Spirochaetia bacterium]